MVRSILIVILIVGFGIFGNKIPVSLLRIFPILFCFRFPLWNFRSKTMHYSCLVTTEKTNILLNKSGKSTFKI